MEPSENSIAKRLVNHFGGRAETARAMGRSTESIRLWLRDGIPVGQGIEVEQKSGGAVTAEEILQDAKRAQGMAPNAEPTQGNAPNETRPT